MCLEWIILGIRVVFQATKRSNRSNCLKSYQVTSSHSEVLVSFTMIVPCVMFLCVYATAQHAFQAGYEYHDEIQGWLKLHIVPTTWDYALSMCFLEGGVLASPTSQEMITAMKNSMSSTMWPGICGVLTGIHSTYTEGDYYTVDGISLQNLPINGKINNHNGQKCNVKIQKYIVLLVNGVGDANETDKLPYICFKKEIKNKTKSCDVRDYKLDSRTGSCYKFHTTGQSWHDAANICAMEGGGLAIINNLLEARVLNDLFLKYPPKAISSDFQNTAMIGFLDWRGKGTWTTIYGQPLGYAGYTDWLPGQPDGARNPVDGTTQKCGGIVRATNQPFSLLDDVWCDKVKMAFICEIPNLNIQSTRSTTRRTTTRRSTPEMTEKTETTSGTQPQLDPSEWEGAGNSSVLDPYLRYNMQYNTIPYAQYNTP